MRDFAVVWLALGLWGCALGPPVVQAHEDAARTPPPGGDWEPEELKITPETPLREARFGFAVAGVGDVDGDGLDDLLVGAPGDSTLGELAGAVHLVYGADQGLGTAQQRLHLPDGEEFDHLGHAVASAGDVGGDGLSDFVVGAYGDDDLASEAGTAWVLCGDYTGPRFEDATALSASDAHTGMNFGVSVAGGGPPRWQWLRRRGGGGLRGRHRSGQGWSGLCLLRERRWRAAGLPAPTGQ